jgi:hypothetical protein
MERVGRMTWTVQPKDSGERVGRRTSSNLSLLVVAFRPNHKPLTVDKIVAWKARAQSRPIICDERDIALHLVYSPMV